MEPVVKKFMSHRLLAVLWTDDLQSAFDKMKAHHYRHLAVVTDKNEVVGIISDRDFQRAMQIDEADFFSGKAAQAEFDPQAKVRDYMCWPLQTVEESKSLIDVAKMMIDKKISAVLVSRDTEIVGILTTEDMLRALVENLEPRESHPIQDRLLSVFFSPPASELVNLVSQAGI